MYDYIIVGAGSSGGVLANRLTESGQEQVCLLEAGTEANSPLIRIPGAFAGLLQDFKQNIYNWRFNTVPDKSMNGRSQYQPRGKGLGGSSSVNGMVYIRGDAYDYNLWEELGNEGWGYEDVLPYFKKAEHNEKGGDKYHGVGGPLNVSTGVMEFDVYNCFLRSAMEVGHRYNPDFNGERQEGIGPYQFTVKDGERAGVRASYIMPAAKRNNLTIETGAHASRIIFEGKRAVGVEFIRKGKKHIVKARKEVIVSSGSFNSPQLLQLSGVGDKNELKEHNIESVHHLPGVGKNLQEHPDVMLNYKSKKKDVISISPLGLVKSTGSLIKYLTRKKGWLACPPTSIGGFLKTDESQPLANAQIFLIPLAYRDHCRDWKMMQNWGFSVLINTSRPKSRGFVTLKDANPLSPPSIKLNLLQAQEDIVELRDAVKKTREIIEHQMLDEYRECELKPGSAIQTDEEIEQFIREEGAHAYHPVGSCKMGNDELSVVDQRLRVHGLQALRIVDCSIMPTLVGGNTNAPAIMIGEKAADMIKQDNQHA